MDIENVNRMPEFNINSFVTYTHLFANEWGNETDCDDCRLKCTKDHNKHNFGGIRERCIDIEFYQLTIMSAYVWICGRCVVNST